MILQHNYSFCGLLYKAAFKSLSFMPVPNNLVKGLTELVLVYYTWVKGQAMLTGLVSKVMKFAMLG